MFIQNKNSASRLEIPCQSVTLYEMGKNRVVILTDDELVDSFEKHIDWLGIKPSGSLHHSQAIINYYYAQPAKRIVSMAEVLLNKKRIHRVNPYPDTMRNTLVFDERLSNFKLSADTKLMLLDANPNLRPYELVGIDNFGDLKETFGFDKMKKLAAKLSLYNY